jgi:hypothetical protein
MQWFWLITIFYYSNMIIRDYSAGIVPQHAVEQAAAGCVKHGYDYYFLRDLNHE